MTVLYDNPADFSDDQLEGFIDLYSDRLSAVPGGVVSHRVKTAQVAVVVGGGSGHYPAFCGIVGPGFATAAVVGNVFTSPSAAQVYSVARAADQGRGVILTFGNYAGDNLNFGVAAERLRKEGIDTRMVVVTDDIASSAVESDRRGIAGDFVVFRTMGAAAAAGLALDDVERIGNAANASTRSFGVAFSGCTLPGETEPLFTIPKGQMGVGLGIHGEPGIQDAPVASATELARLLVREVLTSPPVKSTHRVAAILNGLGATKYEELFLVWRSVAPLLRDAGLEIVEPEVGELVTSLDMGGCSLTITWLDEELERMWRADAYTPGYRKCASPRSELRPAQSVRASADQRAVAPRASAAGISLAGSILDGLRALSATMHQHESELGRIDAVAGDGDHGRGMVKGAEAALSAVEAAAIGRVGPGWVLQRAGEAWAAAAGGTSGVLWGAGLESAGAVLPDDRASYSASDVVNAARAFTSAITDLGRAKPGDKTIVDALVPFVRSLEAEIARGVAFYDAWRTAAVAAEQAAAATAELKPKLGRARPLAEKSIGTPDPGATSFALIVGALGGSAGSVAEFA